MHRRLREEFELLGDLGQGSGGEEVWLGRERQTGQLVALALTDTASPGDSDRFTILRDLGPQVPAGERKCYVCNHVVRDWRRFCGQCGSDMSGRAPDGGVDLEPADLNTLLSEASRQNLDVLGQMRRADGGGAVYFARERSTQEIVALGLRRAPTADGTGTLERTSFTGSRRAIAPATTLAVSANAPPAPPTEPPPPMGERVCPACSRTFSGDIRFCSHDGTALRAVETDAGLIGQIVAERYLVLRRIGRGGMGEVFLAEHVKMGRRCALKVLHRAGPDQVGMIGRFAREAANASRITHPNVATIYDFGETSDRLIYLAMEYVEGEPLSATIRRDGRLAPERARQIGAEIAAGLSAAHREGVIHRDLKPDNILVGRNVDGHLTVKVVDFGIAKALNATASDLTQTGFVVGTPQYMSPEQLIAEAVDFRSDIYSLGCVLYEMLTGAPPFSESQGPLRLTRRLTEAPPDARAQNVDVTEAFASVVAKSLARVPDQRFQTAADLRAALLALDFSPVAAGAATRTTRPAEVATSVPRPVLATATSPGPAAPTPEPAALPAVEIPARPGFATRVMAGVSERVGRAAAAVAARLPRPRVPAVRLPALRPPALRLPAVRLPALQLPRPHVPRLALAVVITTLVLGGAGISVAILSGPPAPADTALDAPAPAAPAPAAAPLPLAGDDETGADAGAALTGAGGGDNDAARTSQQAAGGGNAGPTAAADAVVGTAGGAGRTGRAAPLGTPSPAGTSPPSTGEQQAPPAPSAEPPSLREFAPEQLGRFRAALQAANASAIAAALMPGFLEIAAETELLAEVARRSEPVVSVDVIAYAQDATAVQFQVRIRDAATTTPPFVGFYVAGYRLDSGRWALIRIRKD